MSEPALRLIEENKKTRAPFLNLSNCGLIEVPAELGELVWLEELSFSGGWWDGDGYKKTQNLGPENKIRSLSPAPPASGLFKPSTPVNPFAGLLMLKLEAFWLRPVQCAAGQGQAGDELAGSGRGLVERGWRDSALGLMVGKFF